MVAKNKKSDAPKGVISSEPSGVIKNPQYGDTGYPEKDIKTSGIKIRGTGAATKGVMARGPMA